MRPEETMVCGLPAVRALFARHAPAIKRLYFDYATGRRLGVMCRALAAARKTYRCVVPEELAKIAGTSHHGGVVAVIDRHPPPRPLREDLARWARERRPLLLLDGVSNAHNLGAIVRTAAFFGVGIVVVSEDPRQAAPGDAAHRVAEGGMACVDLYRVPVLAEFIRDLSPAFEVIGTAVRSAAKLKAFTRPTGRDSRPIALVLGNEERGLSPAVAAACEHLVIIPGAGAIESLNVSAAAAILIHHFVGDRLACAVLQPGLIDGG